MQSFPSPRRQAEWWVPSRSHRVPRSLSLAFGVACDIAGYLARSGVSVGSSDREIADQPVRHWRWLASNLKILQELSNVTRNQTSAACEGARARGLTAILLRHSLLVLVLAIAPAARADLIYTWHETDGKAVTGSLDVLPIALTNGAISYADVKSFTFTIPGRNSRPSKPHLSRSLSTATACPLTASPMVLICMTTGPTSASISPERRSSPAITIGGAPTILATVAPGSGRYPSPSRQRKHSCSLGQ